MKSLNRCVAIYLVASYMYYKLDSSILKDTEFDAICQRLLYEWDDITHQHKKYLNKESLKAGTGFDIDFISLPTIISMTAHTLNKGIDCSGNKINVEDWFK